MLTETLPAPYKEWEEVRKRYKQALDNFSNAEGEYVDVAILELNAVEARMGVILREAKTKTIGGGVVEFIR